MGGITVPKQIWNMGRVAGFSAFEIYVRQHMETDPDTPPATERQWLASSLAMGVSMLMQVPSKTDVEDTDNYYVEYTLPSNSRLCAANTVIASFFDGDAQLISGSQFASKVTDYGELISNTSSSSPNEDTIPTQTIEDWSATKVNQLKGYMRILDGIVIQPGTWTDSTSAPPQKDFTPDLSKLGSVRLHLKGPIVEPFWVLLTGFSLKTVVTGESGLDGVVPSPSPEDGDFLGPGQYPWANKIIFTTPSAAMNIFLTNRYSRELPDGATSVSVDDNSIIDMRTTNPGTYYEANYSAARVNLDVLDYTSLGAGAAVLSTYQKSTSYPPALYGTYIDAIGLSYLNPIDTVAPGSIKMFEGGDLQDILNYQNTFYGVFGMIKNPDGTINVTDENDQLVPIADTSFIDITHAEIDSSSQNAKAVQIETGSKTELMLSVGPGGGSQYTFLANPNASNPLHPVDDNIYWAVLLESLANQRTIDILGDNLKDFKSHLPDIQSSGVLNLSGTGTNSLNGPLTVDGNITSEAGHHLVSGKEYIEFSNGLRLYISSTPPSSSDDGGIPVGSIGIGWGFAE